MTNRSELHRCLVKSKNNVWQKFKSCTSSSNRAVYIAKRKLTTVSIFQISYILSLNPSSQPSIHRHCHKPWKVWHKPHGSSNLFKAGSSVSSPCLCKCAEISWPAQNNLHLVLTCWARSHWSWLCHSWNKAARLKKEYHNCVLGQRWVMWNIAHLGTDLHFSWSSSLEPFKSK